jgi:uncharacterized protein
MMRHLTRRDARRIAVRAQLLDADRPVDLATLAHRLTFLQLDPTAAIAPSADLVAWSRLGDRYQPSHLQQAVTVDRSMFETQAQPSDKEPVLALVRPTADLALYLADMIAWRQSTGRAAQWVRDNGGFRGRILETLAASGPLASRDIPDTAEVPWQSSGWTHDRNVTQMLEFLLFRGEVAVAGRKGRQRIWDLAERVYPPVEPVPADEARRIRDQRRLRSLGVARPGIVGDAGVAVDVEGTSGEWRIDPEATAAGFEGRMALLSPFDRLIHDRTRALELFEFEYTLEMYKPAPQRRWGYFALPILDDDRMVGKLDATADRKTGELRVNAVHQDAPFPRQLRSRVDREIGHLANWLGLEAIRID